MYIPAPLPSPRLMECMYVTAEFVCSQATYLSKVMTSMQRTERCEHIRTIYKSAVGACGLSGCTQDHRADQKLCKWTF